MMTYATLWMNFQKPFSQKDKEIDMFKILSVDWDFFFPDVNKYDWQMDENRLLFYEWIWTIRWSNTALFDPKIRAKEDMWPRSSFLKLWDQVCPSFNKRLVICDSHLDILRVIDAFTSSDEEIAIINFDQHHDWGYGNPDGKESCGNWARQLEDRLIDFWQIYPDWRRDEPERNIPDHVVFSYEEEIYNQIPKDFDLIFICRSSPWTPAWADRLWLRFIEYWKGTMAWRRKIAVDYALKARSFDFKEAINNDRNFTKLREGRQI